MLNELQKMELRILTVLEESLIVILENQKALLVRINDLSGISKLTTATDEAIKKLKL